MNEKQEKINEYKKELNELKDSYKNTMTRFEKAVEVRDSLGELLNFQNSEIVKMERYIEKLEKELQG